MAGVELRDIPPMRVLALARKGSIGAVSSAFGELYSKAFESGAPVEGPALTVYNESPSSFDPTEVEFSVCLPLAGELEHLPEGCDVIELPAVRVAVTLHEGPYEGISPTYESLLAWVDGEGLAIEPPVREVYIKGPDPDGGCLPSDYRTEVQFPVS